MRGRLLGQPFLGPAACVKLRQSYCSSALGFGRICTGDAADASRRAFFASLSIEATALGWFNGARPGT